MNIRKIGVLTSGGDSPGMNAAIRAVVRQAISSGVGVVGIRRGFSGIFDKNFLPMDLASVANIIQRGGTMLLTDRCKEFHEPAYRAQAAQILRDEQIDGLAIIGGDGSFRGAHLLSLETGIRTVGIPGTIDNDIFGSEYTIGFDTAINTAVEAVDKIRDTAGSHERTFLVEVMGRSSGFIAAEVGLSVGAELVVMPEDTDPAHNIHRVVRRSLERGKRSSIIVLAEGELGGRSYAVSDKLKSTFSLESKVCVLGHIQRGGSPSARDRVAASTLGALGVQQLLDSQVPMMVGYSKGTPISVPIETSFGKRRAFDDSLSELTRTLSS